MYSTKAKNILCGVKGIHGESLFMRACVAFPINKTCEEMSKNISRTHTVLSTQKPSLHGKSSAWMALEKDSLSISRSHYSYYSITTQRRACSRQPSHGNGNQCHRERTYMAVLPLLRCFIPPMRAGVSCGFSSRPTGSGRQIWCERVEPGASCSR